MYVLWYWRLCFTSKYHNKTKYIFPFMCTLTVPFSFNYTIYNPVIRMQWSCILIILKSEKSKSKICVIYTCCVKIWYTCEPRLGHFWCQHSQCWSVPDSKVHGANMGPTWVLSALDGPHVGPMNLAIRAVGQLNDSRWPFYTSVVLTFILTQKDVSQLTTLGNFYQQEINCD